MMKKLLILQIAGILYRVWKFTKYICTIFKTKHIQSIFFEMKGFVSLLILEYTLLLIIIFCLRIS